MLTSQLLMLTALVSGLASAAPLPQFGGTPGIPPDDTPGDGGDSNEGPDDPPPNDGEVEDVKTGYTLLEFSLDVKEQASVLHEIISFKFVDNSDSIKLETNTATGTCEVDIAGPADKPTSNYICQPEQYVAVHSQLGELRGDGAEGSTDEFSINMFIRDSDDKYTLDFGDPIFKHPNISCTDDAPPYSCRMTSTQGWAMASVM